MVPAETALIRQRPAEQGQDVFLRQGLQHENLAPGKKRAVDLEGRILRRGADEHDAALFHKRKEGVLLGLVETVDFVHEDDGAHAVGPVFLGLEHDLADFLNAAGDGGKIDEGGLRLQGDDPGEGRFPDPGRAPEDHG